MEEVEVTLDDVPLEVPEKKASSVPWKKAIPIYIALWCEAFNSSSIFAYVGFMVLDFGMSKSENDASFMYVFPMQHSTEKTDSFHVLHYAFSLLYPPCTLYPCLFFLLPRATF